MKTAFALALAAAFAFGCATAPQPAARSDPPKPAAPAKVECTAPPSDLVVRDITPGSGRAVTFRTAVNVHYTGWLFDGCAKDSKGAQFDSSSGRGMPFGFVVGAGRVIKGWDEGLIGMKEKGKRLLVIPPGKAYGSQSNEKIPANSTLVFEVDLVQIIHQPEPVAK